MVGRVSRSRSCSGYDGKRRPTVIVSLDPGSVRARRTAPACPDRRPGRGNALDANVIVLVRTGGGEDARSSRSARRGRRPVKFSFRGDPSCCSQPRPFRYRYEVGG